MTASYRNFIAKIRAINPGKTLKTFLPFILGILSSLAFYFISDFLNREIITVQSVFVRPKEVIIQIDKGFEDKIRNLVESTLENDDYYYNEEPSDRKTITNAEAIKLLESWEKSLQLAKENYEEAVKNEKSSNEINSDEVPTDSKLTDFEDDFDYKKYAKERVDLYNEAISSLSAKIKNTLEDNNDDFQIEVVIFNEGNQQTVIRNKGKLILGDISVDLKNVSIIKTSEMNNTNTSGNNSHSSSAYESNYVIIEPKSFIVLNLELDGFNNNNRDYARIQKEYKRESSTNTMLLLYDIKNKPIKSFEFKLQNDIEYDPNMELRKRISSI